MLNVHPSIILICTSTKATTCLNKNITPSNGYLCFKENIWACAYLQARAMETTKTRKETKMSRGHVMFFNKRQEYGSNLEPHQKNNHFPTVLNTWLSNILCDGSKFPRVEFCLYYQIELYAN